MFDLLGWRFDYEPIDLAGYIPDFIIRFPSPVLIEVKPAMTLDELALATKKVDASGWTHEAMIVGATTMVEDVNGEFGPVLGLGREATDTPDGIVWHWGPVTMFDCDACGRLAFLHNDLSWRCRRCGTDTGRVVGVHEENLTQMWAQAGNATQWMPTARAI